MSNVLYWKGTRVDLCPGCTAAAAVHEERGIFLSFRACGECQSRLEVEHQCENYHEYFPRWEPGEGEG